MKNNTKTAKIMLITYQLTCYCVTIGDERLKITEIVTAENFEEARKVVSQRLRENYLKPVTGFRRDVLTVIYFN